MRLRVAACIFVIMGAAWAFQRPFREYPGQEYTGFEIPPNPNEQTEFIMGRLMFPLRLTACSGASTVITTGVPGTRDGPTIIPAPTGISCRRCGGWRVSVRSTEQPINLDDGDDVFDWPWIFAVESSPMDLTAAQSKKLREYLLRGGFLMCADTWGDRDWQLFATTMKRVFPERDFVEVADGDSVFHVLYDLKDRYGIPGEWSLHSGVPYLNGGRVGHWRGLYDDKRRLMVMADMNSDTSDSWEWADEPRYPEKYSAQGIRIGVNYIIYAMTH